MGKSSKPAPPPKPQAPSAPTRKGIFRDLASI